MRVGLGKAVWPMAVAALALLPLISALHAQPASVPALRTTASDPIAALVTQQQSQPIVIGMRLGEQTSGTRIVVELSDPVQAHVFTLTNPNRVVIDLPEVIWRIGSDARPTGKGAVASYRYGLFRQGNSRFVIDLNNPVRVDTPRL